MMSATLGMLLKTPVDDSEEFFICIVINGIFKTQ